MKVSGEMLKFLRESKGIDQRSLAKHLSISQSAVSAMEIGRMQISPKNNKRIVNFFEVSEADVIRITTILGMAKQYK